MHDALKEIDYVNREVPYSGIYADEQGEGKVHPGYLEEEENAQEDPGEPNKLATGIGAILTVSLELTYQCHLIN